MKKIISVILAFSMVLSLCSAVTAAESEAFGSLSSLKILPQEITVGNADELVTRENFAYMAAKMMFGETRAAQATVFSDVDETNKYSGYINYLAASGVISGGGDGSFNPQGYMTMSAAYKILVTLLGYASVAENYGGFPDGFEKIGIDLKLYDGADVSEGYLTNGGAVNMVYNALTTAMASGQYYATENGLIAGAEKDKEKTILSDVLGISIYSGVVESVNLSKESLVFKVEKSKNSANKVSLTVGASVTLSYSSNVNAAGFKYAPVTIMLDEDGSIVGMNAKKGVQIKVGCISSVNGNSDENTQPYNPSGISRITLLDDETEYDVSESVRVYCDEALAVAPVKLVGQTARVIFENDEIISIETWSLAEGGIITNASESEIVYTKGENTSLKLKNLDAYKNKYIYIDGRSAETSEIKPNSTFSYYVNDDTAVVVISEKIVADVLYTVGTSTLEIGDFIYRKGSTVYYKTGDGAFKANGNFTPLLGGTVKAYIAPNGKVLYVEPLTGTASNDNIFMGLVTGYNTDNLDAETLYLKVLRFHPEISEAYYDITEKTVFHDSLTRDIIKQNSNKIGSDYVYEFEVNDSGKVVSVKQASWLFGHGARTEKKISTFTNDGTAMLMNVNSKPVYFKDIPLTFVYETENGIAAQNVSWTKVYGKSCAATVAFFTFDGEEYSSTPDLVFVFGDGINALSSQRLVKLGIATNKRQSLDKNGDLCVAITVCGGASTYTYNISNEVAASLGERTLITYYDDMMFSDREISITGMVDLSGDPSTWNVKTAYAAEGIHKGTVEKIDSIRLIAKDDSGTLDANFFHPNFNFFVELDLSNPNNSVRNITVDDISYGDEVYYNVMGDGVRGVIVVR